MTQQDVRVRIAPSPTGAPHVGTAYIGLFNLAFARANGGKFVIRIEDTDRARSTQRSEDAILRSLRWIGLEWDEGPDVGGPYGPYRQSERLHIYHEHVDQLIASGAAYRCVCTPERLDAMRKAQREAKQPIRYDGHCRHAAESEINAAIAQGLPSVVRMAVPTHGATVVRDAFRDPISIENSQTDDQILLKSDGYPTYHLAAVVDDHLMGISHVIRAEEWISSTPKHLMLYQAFGWTPPVMMHMPLLRNTDKSKISKRKNPVSLEYYERQGYLPEALLNFLGLMGWSMPDEREMFSLDEMIEAFTFDRLSLGGPVFDLQKLDWLNGIYLRQLSPEALAKRLQEQIIQPKVERLSDPAFAQQLMPLLQERLRTLGDFHTLGVVFLRYAPGLRRRPVGPQRQKPARDRQNFDRGERTLSALRRSLDGRRTRRRHARVYRAHEMGQSQSLHDPARRHHRAHGVAAVVRHHAGARARRLFGAL